MTPITIRFIPPTHEEPIRTNVRPLNYYRMTWAKSVVKVNGTFTSIRTPHAELLEGLEEGVEFFRGGREYDITEEVQAALAADGYESIIIPDPPVDPVPGYGYGEGTYGGGLYGGGGDGSSAPTVFGGGLFGGGLYGG